MVYKRGLILLSLLFLLAAIILLSSRLSGMQLEQGAILASDITPTPGSTLDDALSGERTVLNIPLLDALSVYVKFVFWGLIPISFFVFLFAPGSRWRRILVMLLTITGVFTAANMFRRFHAGLGNGILGEMEAPVLAPAEGTPIVAPTTSEPSPAFSFLISFLIAGILVVSIWLTWRWLNRRRGLKIDLADQAEQALQDLRAGADLAETVRECYYQMTDILEEEAGMQRKQGMTPREFEESLQHTGVPHRHVRRLTRLFERARYGGLDPGEGERQGAVESLREISRSLRNAP